MSGDLDHWLEIRGMRREHEGVQLYVVKGVWAKHLRLMMMMMIED